MNTRNYQLCNRCVMDTTDLEIAFDENGFCSHCTEFLSKRAKFSYRGKESDEALARIIEVMKRAGKGRDFDCIVGISGGVDSCYSAFIAKENGLRVLAVHMDNGWNSTEAVINIKNVVAKLSIDYESFVLDWEEFKDLQLAFLKASVPEAETPTDIAILSSLHQVAAKYNVKYIISGGNNATEGILPKSWHYNTKDLKHFNYIQETFGKKRLKAFPTFGVERELYYKLIKRMRMVYLLDYVPFEKESAMQLLSEKLDWKFYGGKHYESRYTRFIQSYYLLEKFGIDYRRSTLSSQICVNQISRSEALEQLRRKPYNLSEIEEEKQYIAKKLNVSNEEFERILNLSGKWYWDYPNDDKKLTFVYDTYRKLYGKEKLGRF